MKEVWSQVLAKAEGSRCEMSVGPVEEACGRQMVIESHTTHDRDGKPHAYALQKRRIKASRKNLKLEVMLLLTHVVSLTGRPMGMQGRGLNPSLCPPKCNKTQWVPSSETQCEEQVIKNRC